MLDGKIYNAKDKSWVQFTGRILEVKPNGILVHGDFGPPREAGYGEREYFVDNFPIKHPPEWLTEKYHVTHEFRCPFGRGVINLSIYQYKQLISVLIPLED